MKKTIVFDMDGTIADLYKVEGWLADLQSSNTRPYEVAKPMYDMEVLAMILEQFKALGWRVAVTTWLSKDSTREYDKRVTRAKREWLRKHRFPADEIHCVAYGVEKSTVTKNLGGYQILVDDNEEVRNSWSNGSTINANENILEKLVELLVAEMM